MAILEEISSFLQKGRAPKVKELVQRIALDDNELQKEIHDCETKKEEK